MLIWITLNRAPSTSTYVPRLQAEQVKIESRLIDLEGVKEIQTSLQKATIHDEDMSVDAPSDPAEYRAIDVKRQVAFNAVRPSSLLLCMHNLTFAFIGS